MLNWYVRTVWAEFELLPLIFLHSVKLELILEYKTSLLLKKGINTSPLTEITMNETEAYIFLWKQVAVFG